MGIAAFHGQAIRALTTGQLPVCMLMSEDNGKAQVMKKIFDMWINVVHQGKSETGKGVLFLVSTKGNKISPNTDSRTVLKVSFINCHCTLNISILS